MSRARRAVPVLLTVLLATTACSTEDLSREAGVQFGRELATRAENQEQRVRPKVLQRACSEEGTRAAQEGLRGLGDLGDVAADNVDVDSFVDGCVEGLGE